MHMEADTGQSEDFQKTNLASLYRASPDNNQDIFR